MHRALADPGGFMTAMFTIRAAQAGDGTISIQVLDWLPRDLREAEARRHLENCPAIAAKYKALFPLRW